MNTLDLESQETKINQKLLEKKKPQKAKEDSIIYI